MAGDQKFCPNCGRANTALSQFCLACGSKFPAITAPPAAPQPPAAPAPADFITLACPSCGGKMHITANIERFACQFCGHEHIVRRSGGVIALEPVMQAIGQINQNISQVGDGINRIYGSAEKQASEAAIQRLKAEIADIQKKAETAGNLTRNVWLAAVLSGGAAVFGWVASYAENGVDSSLESMFTIFGLAFTIFTALIILAAITSTASDGKRRREQEAILRQKREEMNRHYQIVSGANRN